MIEVLTTGGSVENLKRLTMPADDVLLGIVQSDVLGFLQRSANPNSRRIAEGLRLVVPLYPEEVHVLAHRGITSLDDLNGKRVVVGAAGSGNIITAVNIFGGIVRCDRVAQGVVEALGSLEVKVPIIIRLQGTNAEEGAKILDGSDLEFTVALELREAAEAVAAAVKAA